MNNTRIKTINGKKPLYYKDIVDYIKNNNKNIIQIKPEIKTYYNSTQNNIKQQVKHNGKTTYQT